MQSVVMADVAGRTAFKAVGKLPLRKLENDILGIAPSPGWDARYDWAGWVPYAGQSNSDHKQFKSDKWPLKGIKSFFYPMDTSARNYEINSRLDASLLPSSRHSIHTGPVPMSMLSNRCNKV